MYILQHQQTDKYLLGTKAIHVGLLQHAGGGDSIGNFTLSSSVIDTDDSSGIVITPAVTISSDLLVENDLRVTNTIYADSFESTNSGVPEIRSSSRIELIAEDAVVSY